MRLSRARARDHFGVRPSLATSTLNSSAFSSKVEKEQPSRNKILSIRYMHGFVFQADLGTASRPGGS